MLRLCTYYFDKNEAILFFEAISQTKKLKSLCLSIDAVVKNPVLSDSIEPLEFKILRFSNESERQENEWEESERGSEIEELESKETERKAKETEEEVGAKAEENIPKQFPNEFLSYLPFGKGVKHLVLNHSSGFAKNIHQRSRRAFS